MELFRLLGTIAINNSDANKALDETSDKGEKTKSKLATACGAIGKGAVAVGKTVATGLAVGGAAFAGLAAKALTASGELEQNMGGSEAVFGKYAEKMQSKAKEAFSQMGLSTSDYLATANKMGSLFQGAGFSIEESMDLSSGAMQRAADVASIMGIDTASAMEAIAGAAKGNFTMMDNLGVAMNDTTIQAYALSKGIDKSTSEMTNQEKIGLAMEMFMEKTAYAAGNYAKENETLAGSLGTAKAALTNFLDGSGDVDSLVSSFENLANVAVNSLTSILPRLTTGLTEIANQVVLKIPPLLQKLLPAIITGAVSLIGGVASVLPGVLDVLVNSALPMLISGIVTITESLISALPGLIGSISSALPSLIPLLIGGLVSMIVALCSNFSQILQPILDNLPLIIESICTALMTNLPVLLSGIIQLVLGIVSAIPQIITILNEAAPMIIEMLVTGLIGCLPQLLTGVLQLVLGILQALPTLLLSPISTTVEIIISLFSGLWTGFGQLFAPLASWFNSNVIHPVVGFFKGLWSDLVVIWDGICSAVSFAFSLIGSIISAAFQIITLPFRFIWENCKEYVFSAFEWIKGKISIATDAIKNLVQIGFGFVKDKIIQPISEAKNKAVEAFTLIKNQILERVIAVKNKISETFNNIKSKISNTSNGIKSTVTTIFSKVKDAMEKPIEKARDTIKSIVDKIKGFFSGLKLKFPNIKLPHFKVSPSGWQIGDLLKGSIPKLGIEWYAKAMQNPIVMTKPTIWGYDPKTGKMQGGGEAGTEVVSGADTLMNMIQTAVSAQNDGILYILERILEILAEYFPDFSDGLRTPATFDPDSAAVALAKPMNRELGKLTLQKARGRG